MSILTERLKKIDSLALSDRINAERRISDMKDFLLVSLYHSLVNQKKFSDAEITEMLESIEKSSVEETNAG